MNASSTSIRNILLFIYMMVCVALACSNPSYSQAPTAPAPHPVELQLAVNAPFRFVAYGDTRFTDPNNAEASNAAVRRTLVQAIADAHPAFISVGGDIVYNGDDVSDWKIWDSETSVWRDNQVPVYPALGNHDLHGDQ
jgi:hypothetical protein